MNQSIRFKNTAVLIGLTIFTIFLCWFLNKTFLVDYYVFNKTNLLRTTYSQLNDIYNKLDYPDTSLSDEVTLTLEKLNAKKNISLFIINTNLQFVYPTATAEGNNDKQLSQINSMVKEYMFNGTNQDIINKELLKKNSNYNIYKVFDSRIESNYIDLVGILDNGYIVLMRTNFESMQESVAISNKFLAYIGIFVILVGTLIMLLVSDSLTKPILQLSDIAKRMSDLDFDIKYDVKRQDEIGILGTSINRLSEKLEETISELKGANNELKTDIEKKIEIDEMRKEFLSNVTHELKTPIALIQGYAEGLKENINEDQEDREFYCDVIIDEALKMNKMVKKLLSLNQIELGYNQVHFERFDIVALIKTVLSSTELFFQQKEANLLFDDYEPIFVWADEYMIEEVLVNYINNALNHIEGTKTIEVKLETQKNIVRISIFNTGVNIPEDELKNIWIKFYKIDKARTREYGGNGIGLSIVKAIMNSINRDFGVINRVNGVEFWFELDITN